jgi:hypothetical protein
LGFSPTTDNNAFGPFYFGKISVNFVVNRFDPFVLMMSEETEVNEDVQTLEETGQHNKIALVSDAMDKLNVSVRLV